MLKKHIIGIIAILYVLSSYAQVAQRYTIADEKEIDVLDFTFFTPVGESFFTAVDNPYLAKIHGDFEEGTIRSNLSKTRVQNTQKVVLDLVTVQNNNNLLDIFSNNEDLYNRWNIYFSKKKELDLHLIYGKGKSYLDLAGLSVKKLEIITSGADIIADYSMYISNSIEMDSLNIVAELGKVSLNNVHLYDAQVISSKIDFGSVDADFSKVTDNHIQVNSIVGGGTYKVVLPKDKNVSIQIKLSSSLMSSIKLPEGYIEIQEGIYQNKSYKKNKGLNFDIQVSFGKILFE